MTLKFSTQHPFLKWAGGKSSLLSQYAPFFPERADTYYEPFVGSAAVFFHLRGRDFGGRGRDFAGQYRLSDVNPELVNVYQVVRDQLAELIDQLKAHQSNHGKDHYYTVREMDREGLDRFSEVERAARMIYLNRTCYNGLWRVNNKGHFNVPMGRYKNPAIVREERLRTASEALQGVQIDLLPFPEAVVDAGPADFVYFDPPYVPVNATSNFTSYSAHDFGEADQRQLATVFAGLQARAMLSNSDVPLVHDLYRDFHIEPIKAKRRINSKAERRGTITEVLVLNY